MPVLRIPTPLRPYTSGKSEVSVGGSNVAEALIDLTTQFPTIKPHLFSEGGELRPFVNLFLGENNIKDLQGVNTPISDSDKLVLIPSIAGGSRHCEERTTLTAGAHLPRTQVPGSAGVVSDAAISFCAGG
jgi:adenylyltransferase/sulfurtransferase